MSDANFLENYLKPSVSGLNTEFTVPLPEIPGLEKVHSFIIQGHTADTVSTNIITKYHSARENLNLIEVYKRTQNEKTGTFVRLVGTMSIARKGHAPIFIDAAVTNVDYRTGKRADLSTAMAMHVPKADPAHSPGIIEHMKKKAVETGNESSTAELPSLPGFWGPVWLIKFPGLDMKSIEIIRGHVWDSYREYCDISTPVPDFDYKPIRDHMIYVNSKVEHEMFKKMGLDVSAEAQGAFFSILSSAI